jgi:hypothetical protein
VDTIFVKIKGVTGTGTGSHHGWLKAVTFGLGMPDNYTLTLSRYQDAASASLYQFFAAGIGLGTVLIDLEKSKMRMELSDVLISGMQAGSDLLTEHIALNFTTIKMVAPVELVGAAAIAGAMAGAAATQKRKQRR